ncbi:hypothetical protein A2U01_0068782, partial [Trifolium medium]|nr:hypothetical protein [Trifolium medium]
MHKTITPSAGDNNSNDDFRLLVTEISRHTQHK